MSQTKQPNPVKVRAGRAGARVRWGAEPPRQLLIGDLPAWARQLLGDAVAAIRNATVAAAPGDGPDA